MSLVFTRLICVAAAIAMLVPLTTAGASDYYAGKTIEFVVGGSPGGGYDTYTRAMARHFARHVPGNPSIVVKNMPGAGGARAGHFVSTVAPKDGTVIGAVTPGSIIGPLLDAEPTKLFDPTAALWLGSANNGTRVCVTFEKSKTKAFTDALAQKTIIGGVAPGDASHDFAYLVKRTTGAQLDIVSGYKGSLDLFLAMERGEVDGGCCSDWSSVKSQKPDWLRDGKLRVLLQIGLQPNDELTALKIPQLWTYVKGDDNRRVAEMIVSQQAFQRPYFTAPGTPAQYVDILRAAFAATMKDPQFLADAAKMELDVSPLPGATVQELVMKFYATPKGIIEQARRAIGP